MLIARRAAPNGMRVTATGRTGNVSAQGRLCCRVAACGVKIVLI